MKIIFICGSLEPGKDGVGDYTRRLAIELTKNKHTIQIISINDRHIQTILEQLKNDGDEIDLLRLPSLYSWTKRFHIVKSKIESFNPHWISLQYVPFAFQNKGLPFQLAYQLKQVTRNANWHIMFHELWVGIDKQASLKNKLLGKVQQLLTRKMIFLLSPKCVHTQTTLYQYMLKSIGVTACYLPLFSNIPLTSRHAKTAHKTISKNIIFVMFGSIHYGAPVKEFMREVTDYAKQSGASPSIIFIGRGGIELTTWLNECKVAGITTQSLGEQDTNVVSTVLLGANVGIVTTPYLLIEKSGSAAAMIEHFLPLISVARNWQPNNNFSMHKLPGIYEYKIGNLKTIFASYKANFNPTNVTNVAGKFINDLI